MAYSKDYRQMILSKLEAGYSYRELADEFQLSTTTDPCCQTRRKTIGRLYQAA